METVMSIHKKALSTITAGLAIAISTSVSLGQTRADFFAETKISASDDEAWDMFGGAVAISEDTIVVGAKQHTVNYEYEGCAYIYRFDGTSWLETKLIASDRNDYDYFGNSVASVEIL